MGHYYYQTKRRLLSLLLLIFSLTAFAQETTGRVSGQIKDDQGAPMQFATVALMSAENKPVTGTVTDANGAFEIEAPYAENYYLKVSSMGYADYQSEKFSLSESNASQTFSGITISENSELLEEVEVTALRPQIVMEADKMVVSVEGTAMAQGSNAFEVLEKSPGVFVDQDGNIQLNGRNNVRIMVDGRPSYLSAQELKSLLEGMSADNIKQIEIVSNPSAKYDAAGQAGIIDIKLKKNTISGTNGSITGGTNNNGTQGYFGNGQVNYKRGKWNTFFNGGYRNQPGGRRNTMYREFVGTDTNIFDQAGKEDRVNESYNLTLGADYEISDRQSIGFQLSGWEYNGDIDFSTRSIFEGSTSNDPLVEAQNLTAINVRNVSGNLHYSLQFDSVGTKMSIDLNAVDVKGGGGVNIRNEYFDDAGNTTDVERLESDNPTGYDILSGQIDFEIPAFGKGKFETGVKASKVTSDNNLMFYFVNGGNLTLDDTRSNHFIYDEQISAGYVSYGMPLGDKWTIKVGLRGEHTKSDGRSITIDSTTVRDYFNLFPSVFVQRTISENYMVNLNYSRRIDRPQYRSLNPFIFYLDPYSWAQGNPLLLPQYTNSFQMTHTIKQKYNLILGYSQTTQFIAEVPQQNVEELTTAFVTSNVDDSYSYNANLIVPVTITQNFTMNNNFSIWHQEFSTYVVDTTNPGENVKVDNAQTSWNFRSQNTYKLNKTTRAELTFDYRSAIVYGLYRLEPNWGLDAALKKSLFKQKVDASVSVRDIFKTRTIVGAADIAPNINRFDQYFLTRSVTFSLTYKFSKGERFRSSQRRINLDEVNRAGGGN